MVSRLDLAHNAIGDEGAKALAEVLTLCRDVRNVRDGPWCAHIRIWWGAIS